MAESVRSWLWAFASAQAGEALEGRYDWRDMPFVAGNRVQVLRFMTFPAPGDKAGVWALVGDKTHCVAVVFHPIAVDAFTSRHVMRLTSIKGALITLTQIRLTVGRIHTQSDSGKGAQNRGGLIYRHLQQSLLLEIGSFQIVSSIGEPIWYTNIHALTSKTGLGDGDKAKADVMLQWMKQGIRAENMAHDAALEHARLLAADAQADSSASRADDSTRLPTPAQRKAPQPSHTTTPIKRTNLGASPIPPSSSPSMVVRVRTTPSSTASPLTNPPIPRLPPAAASVAFKAVTPLIPTVIVLSPTLTPAQLQAPPPPAKRKLKSTNLPTSHKQAKRDKAIAAL